MINVLIINHHALPPYLFGGTRHYDLASHTDHSKIKITIFASSYHYQKLEDFKTYNKGEYYIKETIDKVDFVWFKTSPYKGSIGRVINMFSFKKNVKKYVKENNLGFVPDIVIGSSVHLIAVDVANSIAKRYKSKFFMEIRDIWPQTLIDMGVSRFNPIIGYFSYLERKLYKSADKIIILLPKAEQHLKRFEVPDSKVFYLPNGINMKNAEPLNIYKNDRKIFTLIYAGAIGVANNLNLILDTAKSCENEGLEVFFRIVGEGSEKERLKQTIILNEITNVSIEDAIPKNKVNSLLRSGDALLFSLVDSPVFKFGLSSNKLFDYLLSGVPVVFSCKAGNDPVKEANAGISVEPNNKEQLLEAIKKLMSLSVHDRKVLGENGYKYVVENHSMEKLGQDFSKLIIDNV